MARAAAVRPDVLLVEQSVARAAQEELLARGISLVQHTKVELLDRISRCTGAKVRKGLCRVHPHGVLAVGSLGVKVYTCGLVVWCVGCMC